MRLFSSPHSPGYLQVCCMALVVAVMLPSRPLLAHAQGKDSPVEHPTFYRTIRIDGLSIFYREAGPHDAPTLLLLHGFPVVVADVRAALRPACPIAITSSRPTTPASATATGRTRRLRLHLRPPCSRSDPFTEALASPGTHSTCRTTGGRSASAWPWPTRSGSTPSSSRTPWPTTRDSGQSGRPGGPSGRTAPPTKRAAHQSASLRRRGRAMSAAIRTSSAMTRICGPTNSPF